MTNSNNLSATRYGTIPNWLTGIILAVGFAGFIDASYITAKRFLGSPLTCYFFGGCDAVNASPYSLLFGVPISLLGSIFYLLVILLTVAYIQNKKPVVAKWMMVVTTLGFLFSMYFLSIQAFVIKAYCFYCVISVFTSTTNFILMCVAWKRYLRIFNERSDYKNSAS